MMIYIIFVDFFSFYIYDCEKENEIESELCYTHTIWLQFLFYYLLSFVYFENQV